ncbi:MAG: trypsin-like peptidase domain-containing protein [Rhodocyclales bacterium]|nr:trypsin-like peptidase domain-containing protein [Rhodocyclales bacterium]
MLRPSPLRGRGWLVLCSAALFALPPALADELAVRSVPTAEPQQAVGDKTRGVALKRMKFAQLANSAVGESAGNAACSDGKPVYLDRKLAATLAEAITYAFSRNLREFGYRNSPGDASVFAETPKKPIEIELGALVQEVQMAYCSKPGGAVEGSLYFKARIELLVPTAQKVVHAPVVEGSVSGQRSPTTVEFFRAGADALVRNFLAEPGVVAWLGGEKPLPPPVPVTVKESTLRLDPVNPPSGGTAGDATLLRASVVTIEGGGRSGSGFVISRQGYVLTNQHVVGSNRFVKLRLASGREAVGEVVQQNAVRDVALIKTESGLDPLALRSGDLAPGETVYAIGSPLGEKFSGSLTRGIVSAYRVRNGQRFIQSDVAILSGSSGGPLLDEKGRVVGLTQSGVEAGRARINLFVPIGDGLKALGVAPSE